MRLQFYSYRLAEEVLSSPTFSHVRDEAYEIFNELPVLKYGEAPYSRKKTVPKHANIHPVDQDALNNWLDERFGARDWEIHPKIMPQSQSELRADFRKSRVQIEVQFGNIARWAYDIFKLQVSYSQRFIDVGISAVPTYQFAKLINSNVAHFERVQRELPLAMSSITLPIMVVGLEPEDANA